MARTIRYFVEGTTAPIRDTILFDGAELDLTGLTIAAIFTGRDGASIVKAATVVTPQTGVDKGDLTVEFAATEIVAVNSPYRVTYRLTDGASKISFAPSKEAEEWVVRHATQ